VSRQLPAKQRRVLINPFQRACVHTCATCVSPRRHPRGLLRALTHGVASPRGVLHLGRNARLRNAPIIVARSPDIDNSANARIRTAIKYVNYFCERRRPFGISRVSLDNDRDISRAFERRFLINFISTIQVPFKNNRISQVSILLNDFFSEDINKEPVSLEGIEGIKLWLDKLNVIRC